MKMQLKYSKNGTKAIRLSYLIESRGHFNEEDPETGRPMVDVIMDAGNKGTGKWASQSALDPGVPLPLITESIFAFRFNIERRTCCNK